MRGGWVLLMIAGVVVIGGLTILLAIGIPIGDGVVLRTRGLWTIIGLMAAGACAAGIFMSPREFRETMRAPPPPPRAAWLDELAKPPADDKRE